MKRRIVALFALFLAISLTMIGYPSNLIILKVTSKDFAGGTVNSSAGTVAINSRGGTTWHLLKVGPGEGELKLVCADGRTAHDGYLEAGALQYLSITVSDCGFSDFAVPERLILKPLDLVIAMLADPR